MYMMTTRTSRLDARLVLLARSLSGLPALLVQLLLDRLTAVPTSDTAQVTEFLHAEVAKTR